MRRELLVVAIALLLLGPVVNEPAVSGPTVSGSVVSPMEPEQIRSIIEQARDAWTTGNAEAFARLFTSDGEFVVPGQVYRGREAIRTVTADFSQGHSGVAIQIHRLIIDGNQAVIEWRWEDTETATGTRTQADDAIVVDFAAGQISRWREYIDSKTPKSPSIP